MVFIFLNSYLLSDTKILVFWLHILQEFTSVAVMSESPDVQFWRKGSSESFRKADIVKA